MNKKGHIYVAVKELEGPKHQNQELK